MTLRRVPEDFCGAPTSRVSRLRLAGRIYLSAAVALTSSLVLVACGDSPSPAPSEPTTAPHWASQVAEAKALKALDIADVSETPIQDSGRRFVTKCVGHGDGSVLLVAGWTGPLEDWTEVQAKVGSIARVCSYNRLGIGGSGPLPTRQTFRTFAADIDRLIDAVKLPRPIVIVGHSLGGPIAMTWASAHLGDTAGVVLVDASDATFPRWQADAMTDQQRADLDDPMASAAVDAEHVDRPAAYTELSHLKSLGSLPLEVLTHDPSSPTGIEADLSNGVPRKTTSQKWLDAQHRWQTFSSSSELITVEGAGHSIQQDDPDSVVAAVLAALR